MYIKCHIVCIIILVDHNTIHQKIYVVLFLVYQVDHQDLEGPQVRQVVLDQQEIQDQRVILDLQGQQGNRSTGSTGNTGFTGSTGNTGSTGDTGFTGSTG